MNPVFADVVVNIPGTSLPELLVPAAAGLVGGGLGVWGALTVERRRDRNERRGFVNLVRSDLMRWGQAMERAADFNRTLEAGGGLQWITVAPRIARYFAPGLGALLVLIFDERELSERAYREFSSPGMPVARAYAARFQMRRWSVMCRVWIEWLDGRSRPAWHRRLRGLGPNDKFNQIKSLDHQNVLLDSFLAEIATRLQDRWRYLTTDDCALDPTMHNDENYNAMLEERAAVGTRPGVDR